MVRAFGSASSITIYRDSSSSFFFCFSFIFFSISSYMNARMCLNICILLRNKGIKSRQFHQLTYQCMYFQIILGDTFHNEVFEIRYMYIYISICEFVCVSMDDDTVFHARVV